MAAFTWDEAQENWPIWNLFQNGAVVLFKKLELLRTAMVQLQSAGYRVHEVDCSNYEEEGAFLGMIVDALGISCYPGGTNRDEFNDYLSQLKFEDCTGVVLVLVRFDVVYQRAHDLAYDVLDILADNQRRHMLFGDRLLTLVQSTDPEQNVQIGTIGGFAPNWNQHEWLLRDRGLG